MKSKEKDLHKRKKDQHYNVVVSQFIKSILQFYRRFVGSKISLEKNRFNYFLRGFLRSGFQCLVFQFTIHFRTSYFIVIVGSSSQLTKKFGAVVYVVLKFSLSYMLYGGFSNGTYVITCGLYSSSLLLKT